MNNIFDTAFNGMARSEMYREWTVPGTFPEQPKARLENWPEDDLEMYCGGAYVKPA